MLGNISYFLLSADFFFKINCFFVVVFLNQKYLQSIKQFGSKSGKMLKITQLLVAVSDFESDGLNTNIYRDQNSISCKQVLKLLNNLPFLKFANYRRVQALCHKSISSGTLRSLSESW